MRPSSNALSSDAKPRIVAIVITLDEAIHIERCLQSIIGLCAEMLIVDSGSSDNTVDIAQSMGARVIFNKFVTHARQVNVGIATMSEPPETWFIRIDADEYLDIRQHDDIRAALATAPKGVAGFELRRHIVFLGRRLRWGGLEPNPQLRIWRSGRGRSEQRWMDEHIVVDGDVRQIAGDLFDDNRNSISWWTEKHNRYASREAVQIVAQGVSLTNELKSTGKLGRIPAVKRVIKVGLYNRLPLATRAFLYFVMRYFILLGFMDGVAGLFFHFLQGFWYRMLVDAKVYELRRSIKAGVDPRDAIRDRLGIDIGCHEE